MEFKKNSWKNEVICRVSMFLGCTYCLQVCMDVNKKQMSAKASFSMIAVKSNSLFSMIIDFNLNQSS